MLNAVISFVLTVLAVFVLGMALVLFTTFDTSLLNLTNWDQPSRLVLALLAVMLGSLNAWVEM